MCIIIAKNTGNNIPDENILWECWQGNSDGAGIAYIRQGENTITIDKGYDTFEKFINQLKQLDLKREDLAIYHFRFATHGEKSAGNCHPFPISNNFKALQATLLKTNIAMAHNGVFSSMPRHNSFSDTQKFIALVLSSDNIRNNLNDKAINSLLTGYCGLSSKLAFISKEGINLIGHWIKDKKTGLYFSNDGYKAYNFNPVNIFDEKDFPQYDKEIEHLKICENCGRNSKKLKLFEDEMLLCKKCWKDYKKHGIIQDKWETLFKN